MVKNYLLIAYRFLVRYKGYSVINILGLATELACTIVIYLWVLDELNYDKFNKNYNSIYRLLSVNEKRSVFKSAATSGPLAPFLKDNFPEIKQVARFRPAQEMLISADNKDFYADQFAYADPELFELFSFNLVEGSLDQFKELTTSLLITEQFAKKCFGNENPIGKSIKVNQRSMYTVVGVIEDIPANSHLQFNMLAPYNRMEEIGWQVDWNNNIMYAYVLLNKDANYKEMKAKFSFFLKKYWEMEELTTEYYLQPLSEVHLKSDLNIDVYSDSEMTYQYVYIFGVVGIIILLIVIINYMNLSTARAARRAKEVGIRKVVGAKRFQLVFQFIGESFILTLLSYFIAAICVEIALPYFNNFTGKELGIDYSNFQFLAGICVIVIFTGLISGSYPAFYLSSYIPINVLKSSIQSGSSAFRKILVVFQFSLSIILIIGTFFVYKQLKFMQKKDLGINKELLLYTPIRGNLYTNYFNFKSELLSLNNVENVTYSNNIPTYTVNSTTGIDWEGRDTTAGESQVNMHRYVVDHDYVSSFNVQIIEGRNFDIGRPADSMCYIINEAALRQMNLKEPVGKWFQLWDRKGAIIGVMKDFNFKSLHRPVEPLILYLESDIYGYMFIKIKNSDIKETIKDINNLWEKYNGEFPMDFKFLDEEYGHLYESEQKLGKLFSVFALIAIFLSCLGLFGLASFMTEKRTKEIGIRKAHGASGHTIIRLLIWDFTKWVVLSMVIAWPISYIYLNKWLGSFAYRTNLDFYIFILAGFLAILIAQVSVTIQAFKASRANPASILKYE